MCRIARVGSLVRKLTVAHCSKFTLFNARLISKATFNKIPVGCQINTFKGLKTMKLEDDLFKSIITPELIQLTKLFERHGHAIRLAGGAVRDLLMGIKPADIDFATTATPEEMKSLFEKENIRMINMKGEEHGTITARIGEENFEVTTLRIDVVTDGRRAKVEFTHNWELDASRRDLTINALFLDLDGTVYDYFTGTQDIQDRRILFVGQPEIRIKEDYLRILRYFRFYGRIAESPSNHDPEAIQAIVNNAEGLSKVSGERIWNELKKILQGKFSYEILMKMIECKLSEFIGLPANPPVEMLKKLKSIDDRSSSRFLPITVVSSLLKSETEMTQLHQRLKLSAFERDLGYFLIQYRFNPPSLKELKAMLVDVKDKGSDVKKWAGELLKYLERPDSAECLEQWKIPKIPIKGNAPCLKELKGPKQMRFVMERLKTAWKDSDFLLSTDDLEKLVPTLLEEYQERFINK